MPLFMRDEDITADAVDADLFFVNFHSHKCNGVLVLCSPGVAIRVKDRITGKTLDLMTAGRYHKTLTPDLPALTDCVH